jgi:hypothetical protein
MFSIAFRRVSVLKLGFQEKNAQFNWSNISGSHSYSFDNPSFGYGGIIDPYRTSWSAGYFIGANQTFYSQRSLLKFGPLKSETINIGVMNISKSYDINRFVLERQFTIDLGFDLAFYYGLSGNARVGF